MLKKIVYITLALAIICPLTASSAELTPLQKKVYETFAKIKNKTQFAEDTVSIEKTTQVNKTEVKTVKVEPVKATTSKNKNLKVEKAEAPKTQKTETPKSVLVAAVAAEDESPTKIIMADDQDEIDEEVYSDSDEGEELVITAVPTKAAEESKENVKVVVIAKPAEEIKTAAAASSKDRTAKINKKWSVQALGWDSKITGHVKIVENENLPDSGEKIDLEKDTRNLDKKTVPGFKLVYQNSKRSSFEFNWVKVEQDGVLKLSREFKGKTYSADSNFEINNQMYDLLWKYKFCHKLNRNGSEKSYLSGLLGVKATKMEFNLNGLVAGNPESTSYSKTIPTPYIGLECGTNIGDDFYFKANVRYLELNNIKKYDAKHCDFDAALSYRLSGKSCNQDMFIDVGYRQIVYDVDGEGNDVKLKFKGPYVGLDFKF